MGYSYELLIHQISNTLYQVFMPMQARLDALSLTPDRFVEQQGGPVASRVDALKELQKRHDELEEQFRRDKAELEAKYEGLYGKHCLVI